MTIPLDQVTDFPALVEYLREELDWPLSENDFEALTFDYKPEEVGLDSAKVGGGIEIKQLRPLNRQQPWGIFFVNLPKKQLSTTILRTLLGSLAPKKRASSNPAERAVFDQRDLMFIASTGDAGHRHIDFAHFRAPGEGERAAPLQVLGWDADDTQRRMGLTTAILRDKLHWPEPQENVDQWRERWTGAFSEPPRYAVKQSQALAVEMAKLARSIRDRASELIEVETDKGALRKLYAGFKEALIHDLTPDKFADYYAQTITYGLFSARVSRPSMGFGHDSIHLNVTGTSPFLKEMLSQFLEAGGRKAGTGGDALDFDALGVGEVIDLLEVADMDSVLADWDHKNQDEDPVVRFYEDFLKLYDPAEKKKRGVFYTPRPVVGFIVRSVDEVLRTEFGLEDGLASTATWGEMIAAKPEIKLPDGAEEGDPFVRILDPATGTGTFLVECVDLIHKTMVRKWFREGLGKGPGDPRTKALWNDYVPKHLLPRLTGFELMMAPYAIAHVKLGLKLADTGYNFEHDARAQIYLTNALEPAQDISAPQFDVMDDALAHEAKAANKAKETRFTLVVGNPPYSIKSYNNGPWINRLMEIYKETVRKEESQIQALSNDYIKFLRLSQFIIDRSGVGVHGMITGHGFLHGTQPRDMRRTLLSSFTQIVALDLNGSIRRSGSGEAGDEPVFEIATGVAVSVMSAAPRECQSTGFTSIRGSLEAKFALLNQSNADNPIGLAYVNPKIPNYQFRPMEGDNDYFKYPEIPGLFGTGDRASDREEFWSTGFTSQQDELAISFDYQDLEHKVAELAKAPSFSSLQASYRLCTTDQWNFAKAKAYATSEKWRNVVAEVGYRPFDIRMTVLHKHVLTILRDKVQSQLDLGGNMGLVVSRAVNDVSFAHAFVSDRRIDRTSLSSKSSTNAYVFPLWLKPEGTETRTLPNIAPAFAKRVAALTGLFWDDCVEGPKQGALSGLVTPKPEQTAMFPGARRERGEAGKSFGPRDLFDYIYAVLHSPAYRARYADYLKSDFARIPLPGSRHLFEALVPLGTELVALHLLDAEALPKLLTDPKSIRLAGSGEARVAHKPEYNAKLGRVAINSSRWFETVPEVAWNFHVGGYQPAQKWLKDRAAKGGKKKSDGRVLTDADTLHYCRMITALTRTAELMPKIDEVIDQHGGWPGAFRGITDNQSAESK